MMNGTPLLELERGAFGVVLSIEAGDENIERLKAIGVCLGRRVEVIQHGDPMIVKVYGTRVGLSARLAKHVLLEPCQNLDCACVDRPVHVEPKRS